MDKIFIEVLNISLTAGFVALAVMLMRLVLRKAPKWICVVMWALVGIRLMFPITLQSPASVVPSAEPIPDEILYTPTPEIYTGMSALNSALNPIISESLAPDPTASINPAQVIAFVGSIIWLIGIAAMLLYTVICCIKVKKQVREAMLLKKNIWICDNITTPFIFGVIRPKIYLPSSLGDENAEYVIAHEKAHIKRRDHLWKPLGFLLLTVYWFNPILWLAYILLCRDIEAACDEKVIKSIDAAGKKNYLNALIECSSPRKIISACPIAFGETNVKGRIKNVLNYKKPTFWIILTALVACIVASVCLLTDPIVDPSDDTLSKDLSYSPSDTDMSGTIEGVDTAPLDMIAMTYSVTVDNQYFRHDVTNGLDVYVIGDESGVLHYRFADHKSGYCDHSGKAVNIYIDAIDARSAAIVLNIYGLDDSKINYIPYEDTPEDCIAKAKAAIQNASLVPSTELERKRVLARAMFDIDGDGKKEYMVAHRVENSSGSKMLITAIDPQTKMPKAITSCSLDAYKATEFVDHNDGTLYINGVIDGKFFEYALGYGTSVYKSYFHAQDTAHLPSLRKMYPEYFELDASKGIDVYCVCDDIMSLRLLSHSDNRYSDSYIREMAEFNFVQATAILSTYNIKMSDIYVKTIYSDKTYAYDPPASTLGISRADRDKSIEKYVLERLSSNGIAYPLIDEFYYYDFLVFDIDGDGKEEKCLLQRVPTSGAFYVNVKIAEFGADGLEYEGWVQSYWSYPYFAKDSDGKIYVVVEDASDEKAYYYEIQISDDGEIIFAEAKVTSLMLYDLFPQYMNLDASNGLDVIVWQMSKESYSFGLLPHTDEKRDDFSSELVNLTTVYAKDMRRILAAYGIDKDKIYVIPWQNPFSSYTPSLDIIVEDGGYIDINDYIDKIRTMLEIN